MMNIENFCNLASNTNSFFCQSVSLIGPLPSQFEIMYLIGFFIYFLGVILIVLAPILILVKVISGVDKR